MEIKGACLFASRRKFAKIIGVSHTYINQKVADGTIPLHAGKIKISEAKEALKLAEDPTRDAQREANKAKRRDKGILPFDEKPKYKTVADMTEEEKAKRQEEITREQIEAEKIRQEAENKGIDTSKDKIPGNLNQIKVFKEFYLGKMAQLDFQIKKEKFVLKEEVEKQAYEIGRLVRNSVMGVPDRISAVISTLDDEVEIRELLTEELISALEAIQK